MLSIKSVERKTWRNWSGTSRFKPEKMLYPSSIDDVVYIVKEARKQNKRIRVVGAGHSFTELVQTDDWLISLDLLSGIESLNEEEKTVTVFAGTRLKQLGEELGEKGYAQENLGDINVQSVAGAISTGTHGTGITFGNISSQVVALTIVTGRGEVLTISEEENAEYFKASLVSLGTLGIIVKVKLKVIETPVYEYRSDKVNFVKLEEKLEQYIEENRHFEIFMFPYSDLVQIKTMNITDRKPQRLFFHRLKNLILENYVFQLLSSISRTFPKSSRMISRLSAWGISKAVISAKSYDLFATPRLVRFTEIEYCIPIERFKKALREVRKQINEKKYNVHFPIECRTVKADDIWLSPSYNRDSAYIAFHMYKGMPYDDYFKDMETIMKKYDGRPHWGKMHHLNDGELKEKYPKWQSFLDVRKKLDPDGIFLNDYLKELLLESESTQIEMEVK